MDSFYKRTSLCFIVTEAKRHVNINLNFYFFLVKNSVKAGQIAIANIKPNAMAVIGSLII